jgi:hypothetical protein
MTSGDIRAWLNELSDAELRAAMLSCVRAETSPFAKPFA